MIKKIVSILVALSLSATYVLANEEKEISPEYEYFEKVSGFAAEMYIDETVTKEDIMKMGLNKLLESKPELVEEILKAGFTSLDDYSEYYTYSEYREFYNSINHTFYGIGVVIQKEGDYVKIVRCLDDGSAVAAGVQTDDKIVKVDGVDVVGQTLDAIQSLIIGELGTTVEVTFLRGDKEYTYKLQRRPVSSETVGYSILEGNIAYVEIINFASSTAGEFHAILDELKSLGVTKIILDLRDNPGGYLDAAVEIGELIVPKGVIVQTMYRQEENNKTFYSELEEPEVEFAVLVNENTASAAEILSAAIQESGVGVLVGEVTFGKALIQEMIGLGDGSAFKITTGKYLTRNGNDINKIGIVPDYELPNAKQKITISNYTQFDHKTKWRMGDKGDGVKAAKERLLLLGYEITSIDNIFNEELMKAVTKFQADAGLFPYGVIDLTTQKHMDNKFSQLYETVDMQLIKAYQLFGGTEEDLYKK